MTCLTELDLMRYCDGELDDVERRDAALHLASCERCGTMVATIRAENATLRAVLLAPWSPPAISAAHIGLRMALTVLAVLIVRWTVGGFDDPSLFSTVPLAITGVVTVLQFVSYPVAFVLAVLLVAATAGLAMRRRPVALMALLLVLIQAQPFAMVRRTGSSAIVAADEVIDDSLFAGADLVRIDGRVNGDVFAMGDRVEVGGVITGRLIAFAQTVSISGSAGSIYGFGRRITVNGAVGEWGAWGEEVRLGPDARVSGASTTMGDSIFLEGSVSAPITTLGHKLTVGPLARIEQRLHARVNRADISPGAFIADATDLRIGSAARLAPEALMARAGVLLLAFAAGWWMWRRHRRWLMISSDSIASWWRTLIRGGATMLLALAVSLALAITIIGLPFAMLALALVALASVAALAVIATFIAEHFIPRRDTLPFLSRLSIALVLLGAASLLGYSIGSAISSVAIIAGVGAMAGTYARRAGRLRTA